MSSKPNLQTMLQVYFVAGSQDCAPCKGVSDNANNRADALLEILQQALKAGITCYQFRDKGELSLEKDDAAQKQLALDCQKLCRRYKVSFIMNDMVDLALEMGADGIHVGQGDKSIIEIREICPTQMVLGLSINTLEQAQHWNIESAVDYFGVGPIFATNSKINHAPPVGMEFIQTLRHAGINKPLVAIGSVKPTHVTTLKKYGATGVAVVSAITQAQNIATTVASLKA
ncbi:thiamine phosphate synthase [Rappaport israeli]|uniref:thiamine phosphate synthase n=1 Tax=Rappaport israeli TaxID=1839807 RepID=UPI000931C1CD|nr:thiamine phosphate synthase [Rappaport israeli]